MTKRQLIELLKAMDVPDNSLIRVATTDGALHDIVGYDTGVRRDRMGNVESGTIRLDCTAAAVQANDEVDPGDTLRD